MSDQISVTYSMARRTDYDAQGNVANYHVSSEMGHFDIFDHGTNQYVRIPVSNMDYRGAIETARELKSRLNREFYPETGILEGAVNYLDDVAGGNRTYLNYGMHDPTEAISESLRIIEDRHPDVVIQNDIRYGGVRHPSMMLNPGLDPTERYETRYLRNFAEAILVSEGKLYPYYPSIIDESGWVPGNFDASYSMQEGPEIHVISHDISSDGQGYITYQQDEGDDLLLIPVSGLTAQQADRVADILNNDTRLAREFTRAVTNVADDNVLTAEESNAISSTTNDLLRAAAIERSMEPPPAAPNITVTGSPTLAKDRYVTDLVMPITGF